MMILRKSTQFTAHIALFLTSTFVFSSLWGQVPVQAQSSPQKNGCEQQVPFLNSRAQILEQFRKKEDQNYQAFRKTWAKRIAYSGQWSTKDAEKTREALYKYDQKHKVYMDELDKQKEVFIPLETNPLNCSDAKKTEREKYFKLAKGESKNKGKEVSGQYAINRLSKEQTKYQEKEFKKVSEKMMKSQQKAKRKDPKPKKSMTVVEEYKN